MRPLLLDMATSVVAAGKVLLKVGTGESVPPGWTVDKTGKPSTTPEDYMAGGAMISAGTYKGYGLALMVDILAGAFSVRRSEHGRLVERCLPPVPEVRPLRPERTVS